MTDRAVVPVGTLVMTLSDHFRTEQHENGIDFTTQLRNSASKKEPTSVPIGVVSKQENAAGSQ